MLSAFMARQPGAPLWRVAFYELCRKTARGLLWALVGLRVRHVGRVPAHGPLLVAANHESYLDPPCVGGAITQRHVAYIARAGLFKWKPFAWLISTLNSVPIREEQGDSAAIRETLRRLELGHAVLIFPEGSRSEDGSLGEFKRGVALLMKKAKCPVLPAAIDGAYEAWPRRQKLPRIFGPGVRVVYGEAIPFDELMKDGPDAGLARIRDEVARLRAQLKAERAAGAS